MSTKKILEDLQYGDILLFTRIIANRESETYLVVEKVENGTISGQMAQPTGVNSISIENLLDSAVGPIKKANFENI